MFPWQGEGKSSVMSSNSTSASQQQQQKSKGAHLRWRSATFWRNQTTDSQDSEQRSSNKASDKSSAEPTRARGTSKPDSPGEEIASSESRASPIDVDEDEDEDGISEGGDIEPSAQDTQHTATHSASNTKPNPDSSTSTGPPPTAHSVPAANKAAILQRLSEGTMPPNRHYGRRLNAKEEVKLFEICNRHSKSFGERSKICEWWKTIANDFCNEHGGPYSWHSVRRKVELVTKQRIQTISDQEEGRDDRRAKDDRFSEELCRVLDEWIPVWKRFEESEKRRIEVRDYRSTAKKRKEPPTTPQGHVPWHASAQRWRNYTPSDPRYPASPAAYPHPQMGSSPATPVQPGFHASGGVKLPEGYDTMFRGPQQPTPPSQAPPMPIPYPPPPPHFSTSLGPPPPLPPQHPSQQHPQPPNGPVLAGIQNAAVNNSSETSVTTAVLETLSKLNKHLEQAASSGTDKSNATTTSPIVTALANAVGVTIAGNKTSETTATETEKSPAPPETDTSPSPNNLATASNSTPYPSSLTGSDLSKLKEALKEEIRKEFQTELRKLNEAFQERLSAMEQTQEMIVEMLRQEPGRESS
ncbi:hypothetical protein BGW36DRAFT_355567 [Talaromyces proteolyticus]|uniref:Uncharacterized protein n=1 Tax=Talaromyces proteolyticus TaxID=1131652 RepID=A0AAD4Q5P4_9EURO|nr:uncharacterized protein BGW36DRAFT_355567 [Talaromyces proteolyticus]KAH8704195.1 hypothetical protein BGW36DRAFT_355567 [Talaromyces proteolyticus]